MIGHERQSHFIEVNAMGQTRPLKQAATRLARVPGLWRLVPEIGRLMLLERVVDNRDLARLRGTERTVRVAGVFDDPHMLASVVNLVQMARWDGAFHVSGDEQVRKVLYFRRGILLSGRSSLKRDRLGHVLVRAGMLSEAERASCADQLEDGVRYGTLLVSRGLMTTPRVYEGLRKQCEEIFFSILKLANGTFRLVQPLDMTEVPAMLRLDVQELLLEGMRRLDEERSDGEVDDELRRRPPIPAHQLPPDGPARIVATYDEAFQRLFMAIDEREREPLRAEITGFIEDSSAYEELFEGVTLEADGALVGDILANLRCVTTGDPVVILQLGLSEMLFFAMFAAGDALDSKVEQVLQHHVAEVLSSLPEVEG